MVGCDRKDSEMKKILIPTGNLARNGTETFIMNMYRNLNLEEFKVDFLLASIDPNGYADEARELGSKFYVIPSRSKNPVKHYLGLWRFFKKHAHEYTALHTCISSFSEITELQMAKHFGIPIIITHAHSSSCLSKFTSFMHHWHQKVITRYANRYLACSESAYKWFYEGVVPRDKAEVIRNGINVDRFEYNEDVRQQIRKQYDIDEGTLVFGHVGRFSDVKNHKHLVNVLAEMVKVEPNVRLLLVGEGENMPAVKAQANDLGVASKIIYVGQQTNVAPFLQAMDCFIMPSLYEGLPFVLVEAQAAGLPFVASTGISTESDILGHAKFISLQAPLNEWVDETLTLVKAYKRFNTKDIIVRAGYSIKNTARRMEQIYSGN